MTFNTARTILAIRFYGTEEGKEINRILNEVDENPWHTGAPTEEGWYIVVENNSDNTYEEMFWDGTVFDYYGDHVHHYEVKAWQKIEPYEEENNGKVSG